MVINVAVGSQWLMPNQEVRRSGGTVTGTTVTTTDSTTSSASSWCFAATTSAPPATTDHYHTIVSNLHFHDPPSSPTPQQHHHYGVQVLATAPSTSSPLGKSRETKFLNLKSATESGRTLLSDRKGWFEHLTTANILKSSIRVAAVQGSNMVAYYLQDQLQADFAREELVKEHKLSAKQADEQQEEWEKREWSIRLQALPNKILTGILKFHAITILMRLYEHVAEAFVDEFTLDRLTRDPYDASLYVETQKKSASYYVSSNSEKRSGMYTIVLWANMIAFLADYSVHQIILTYTYYVFYQSKRKNRMKKEASSSNTSAATSSSAATNAHNDIGPLVLSYLTKSTSLMVSRGVGLFAAAIGGAWGSAIWPGMGVMIGSQFCDGVVSSVFDELQPASLKVQN